MENNPLADGAFWANALQQRLEGEFASAEVSDTGGFQVLRLVERADDPYTWLIAIRPREAAELDGLMDADAYAKQLAERDD